MRHLDAWIWIAVLLIALFSDAAFCRKGGGGRSSGRGSVKSGGLRGGFQSLAKSSSGSSLSKESSPKRGTKMAGVAAAGAAVGYGMGLLGRSRAGRGTSGGKQMTQSGFYYPNWSEPFAKGELYNQAPKGAQAFTTLILSLIVCCLNIFRG